MELGKNGDYLRSLRANAACSHGTTFKRQIVDQTRALAINTEIGLIPKISIRHRIRAVKLGMRNLSFGIRLQIKFENLQNAIYAFVVV